MSRCREFVFGKLEMAFLQFSSTFKTHDSDTKIDCHRECIIKIRDSAHRKCRNRISRLARISTATPQRHTHTQRVCQTKRDVFCAFTCVCDAAAAEAAAVRSSSAVVCVAGIGSTSFAVTTTNRHESSVRLPGTRSRAVITAIRSIA